MEPEFCFKKGPIFSATKLAGNFTFEMSLSHRTANRHHGITNIIMAFAILLSTASAAHVTMMLDPIFPCLESSYESLMCTLRSIDYYYSNKYSKHLTANDYRLIINKIFPYCDISKATEEPFNESVQFGLESFDLLSMYDISLMFDCGLKLKYPMTESSFYKKVWKESSHVPKVYGSYSVNKLEQREKLRKRTQAVGLEDIEWITFGEAQQVYEKKDWLAAHFFSSAAQIYGPTDPAISKNMLSSLNGFEFVRKVAEGNEKYGIMLEDDALPVVGFQKKFRAFVSSLPEDTDLAFLGTCLDIHNWYLKNWYESGTPFLFEFPSTRCFNSVLISKQAAKKILDTGALVYQYTPVDHYFNKAIESLQLKTYWAMPPLFYESSKVDGVIE
jgi:hypothetical protein